MDRLEDGLEHAPADSFRGVRAHVWVLVHAGLAFATTTAVVGQTTASAVPRTPATASGWVSERWLVEHGLPSNEITDIAQTPDGYLWLATFDGLVRFDGLTFTIFDIGNTPGLPANRIVELHASTDGTLWIRTETGHVAFRRGTTFGRIEGTGPGQGDAERVLGWVEDTTGVLWLGTPRGVRRIRDRRAVPMDQRYRERVEVMLPDRGGALWIGSDEGLARHRDGRIEDLSSLDPVFAARVHDIVEDARGHVWVATERGTRKIVDHRSLRPGPEALWDLQLERLELDPRGRVTVAATENAVWVLEGAVWVRKDWISEISTLPAAFMFDPDGVLWSGVGGVVRRRDEEVIEIGGRIRMMSIDREGSLWIAGMGLHRVKPTVVDTYGAPEGFGENFYSIYEDTDGSLWFGSLHHGATHFDGSIVTRYPELPFAGKSVRAFLRTHPDTLWLGTLDGACAWDGQRCRPARGPEAPLGDTRAFARDDEGVLWAGSARGLFRNDQGGEWRHFTREDGMSHDDVRLLHLGRDGSIWIGTYGGGVLRHRDGRFEALTTEDGLSSDLVRSFYEDEAGVLWIGTEGRGLNRVELDDDGLADVTVYRSRDGLFDDVLHQILEDDFGRVWMSTNRGIFWIRGVELEDFAAGRIEQVHSTVYTERDGLRTPEANGGVQSAGLVARDGRLWFPTIAGAAVIDPSEIEVDRGFPPVVIEEVSGAGRRWTAGDEPVTLPRGQRSFEIGYTALSFLSPANIRFRYRLEGLDEEWVHPGTRRTAFYTNVPPGRYRFVVSAAGATGWGPEVRSAPLVVVPFFWETGWFRVGGVVVVLTLLATGVRARERSARARERELAAVVESRTGELVREKEESERARREAEEHRRRTEEALAMVEGQAERLRELDETKSRLFANVSHDFRTPLTLTIGPLEDIGSGLHGEIPEEAGAQVDLALRNARRLLRLVNQMLDVARLEAGHVTLDVRPHDLVAHLEGVLDAFTPLAERRGLRLALQADTAVPVVHFDQSLVEKVFANLLSNAVKFTPEGGEIVVRVRTDPEGEWVTIEVHDTGLGIPDEVVPRVFDRFYRGDASGTTTGTGIGLSLVRELIQLHGGEVEVRSELGVGTTFVVHLPVEPGLEHRSEPSERVDTLTAPGAESAPYVRDLLRDPTADDAAFTRQGAQGDTKTFEMDAPESVPGSRAPDLDEDATTVLVVDDDAEVRAYVGRHLSPDFRVIEAADGVEGLSLARSELPDVVVCDVMMPEMDGRELCRTLRSDPELAYLPVLLLTARAEADAKVRAIEEGADDYLTKPFDPAELRARIGRLIEARRELRRRILAAEILHAPEVDPPSRDEIFLEKVRDVVVARMADEDFDVDALAEAMGMSRSHLYRRLGEVHRSTPAEVIRSLRMDRAAQLLAADAGSVAEIAYGVGFKSVSHFSRSFKSHFGVPPSRYQPESSPDASD